MQSTWRSYKNGNFITKINLLDGTKIRETDDDDFIPSFAENVDILTSQRCDNGCPWCYAGCTPNGKHGELIKWKFIDTLHPYTEAALNLNFPMPDRFIEFLHKLKSKKVIANVTINQKHFEEHHPLIKSLIEDKLVYGIGVSLVEATDKFIDLVKQFPTAVIHTINGVTSEEDYKKLADNNLKILILGYKEIGRGVNWKERSDDDITCKQNWVYENLEWLARHFHVVSFDNLAITQLNVRRLLTDEQWEEFYMGDDGSVTFFIDLVDGTFGRNSLATKRYPILDSIDEMFEVIRKEKEHGE